MRLDGVSWNLYKGSENEKTPNFRGFFKSRSFRDLSLTSFLIDLASLLFKGIQFFLE